MTMNITYDYYRIFYYVAKYGSFTKAAEIIGNSQPNITRAMNNLESQIGLKLFIRNKRGIVLTPEGEQLFEHIKVAFFHIYQAEEEMKNQSSMASGSVVIGVSEIALHEVLLPVLSGFNKKYPDIKGGFIHIPYMTSQVIDKEGMPFMSLEEIVKGLELAIEACTLYDEDIEVIGGKIC